MKTYTYNSELYGFQMSIPDNWSGTNITDLIDNVSYPGGYEGQGDSLGKRTYSRTIVGPDGKYLNILITPLLENEPEPSIKDTMEFFDGWSYKQNLHVIKTGTIHIANKEHFWATYDSNLLMSIMVGGQMQFFKKYCLYLNRVEYLITAGLYCVNPGEKLPTDKDLGDSEKTFDGMVSSMKLLNA